MIRGNDGSAISLKMPKQQLQYKKAGQYLKQINNALVVLIHGNKQTWYGHQSASEIAATQFWEQPKLAKSRKATNRKHEQKQEWKNQQNPHRRAEVQQGSAQQAADPWLECTNDCRFESRQHGLIKDIFDAPELLQTYQQIKRR